MAGDVARNWGMIAGLRGGLSLLPLAILIVGAFAATWYATRKKGEQQLAEKI
jgi:ABC-type branched-subunit amino acid transport system permease subunit